MNRKLVSLFLALLLAVCPIAFAEDASITVTDMMGRDITLSEPATRIVALTASDCEILYALGAGDMLVGRGEYCDYPPEVLEITPVQSGMETNVEQILSLNPQVVLMSSMAQAVEVVNQLESAGIAVVVSDAKDIEGTYTAIRLIGALMGRDGEAEAIVADMQAAFDDIAAKAENTGKTIYFESSPLQWGLWAAGSGTFMDELAAMCGLTNAFADVESYAAISEEQVLERNPDYIVTNAMAFGDELAPDAEIMSRAGWESISAVANGDVYWDSTNAMTRPGPRLKDAAIALYEFISAE